MSSEAQPLTNIMSAVMIIAINSDYRAHLVCLFNLQFTSIIEVFPTQTLYAPLLFFPLIRATFPAQIIRPYFITRTIFGEEYIKL